MISNLKFCLKMKRILFLLVALASCFSLAMAQKTCVIASAEDHVPIREALIHTDNNHWARTDYRGYWNMKYQFDSATVSKTGYVKTTIYLKNLPDTVFLLPESHQISTVEVWGKNGEHIQKMEESIQKNVDEQPRSSAGFSFDALGWMDKQGKRDRKHMKQAQEIFKKLDEKDRKDPIIAAYEKAVQSKNSLKPIEQDSLKRKPQTENIPSGKIENEENSSSQGVQLHLENPTPKEADKRKMQVSVESSVSISR